MSAIENVFPSAGVSAAERISHSTSKAWPWLLAAVPLLLFSNGRVALAPIAWIAPALLVRYLRTSRRAWPAIGIAYAACVVAWAFQFRGMAPVPGILYWILAAGFGLIVIVPFAIDRLLAARVAGLPATLILPTAWVAAEYAAIRFSPYSSWGSIAYSQAGANVLLQLLSVTGMLGITFLIGWFASIVNLMLERGSSARQAATAFAIALAAVLIWGSARLLIPQQAPTVRVASLSGPGIALFPNADVQRRAMNNERLSDAEMAAVRASSARVFDELLLRSAREAQAGARIVFWGEASSIVMREDEQAFLARAAAAAKANALYLGLGVGIWHQGDAKPLENKIVLIDPSGKTVLHSLKARPVPPGELAMSKVDDGRIKTIATPFGRIAAAICFDMDFPVLLQEAGKARADILLAPSNDWREIDPWHTQMATFRAIEQGFNLVRHASGGLSEATDGKGRILATMDHYASAQRTMVSFVPTRREPTLYARTGDLFAYSCLIALAILIALSAGTSASRARRSKTPAA